MWNSRIGEDERKAIVGARAGQQTAALDAEGAVDYAMSHCFERASTVTKTKFLQTALVQSYGKASVADVRRAAIRDGVLNKERNGQRYVTTRDVLKEEIDMTNYVRDGRATRRRLGGDGPIDLDPKLPDEQRKAALMILNSRDKVTALQGRAGTGKTTMMRATVGAIEKTGKQVFTFAPSAEASHGVLREEGDSPMPKPSSACSSTRRCKRSQGPGALGGRSRAAVGQGHEAAVRRGEGAERPRDSRGRFRAA